MRSGEKLSTIRALRTYGLSYALFLGAAVAGFLSYLAFSAFEQRLYLYLVLPFALICIAANAWLWKEGFWMRLSVPAYFILGWVLPALACLVAFESFGLLVSK